MRKISLLIGIALFCTACCTNNKKTNLNETASFADSTYNGQWAEKSAERIVAKFTLADTCYHVEIGWREKGLAQYEIWEMTAENAESDTLVYSNALYYVKQYEHEEDSTFITDTVYTDGFGTFFINTEGNLVWNDGKDSLQEATVFIRANFEEK
ncbi:MAG: hypothetical protein ILP24_05595 [Paludibacteraceae bacterium]|nr:hypothetical protein [Paludibacteraceae bacterium]